MGGSATDHDHAKCSLVSLVKGWGTVSEGPFLNAKILIRSHP
jgi:hypothetical protein